MYAYHIGWFSSLLLWRFRIIKAKTHMSLAERRISKHFSISCLSFVGRDGYFFAQEKPELNIFCYLYFIRVNCWTICDIGVRFLCFTRISIQFWKSFAEYSGQDQKNNRYKTCRTTLDKTQLPVQCLFNRTAKLTLVKSRGGFGLFYYVSLSVGVGCRSPPFQSVFTKNRLEDMRYEKLSQKWLCSE